MAGAGVVGVFGVDLGQRDVGPAVVGPRDQLRELVDRRLVGQHRPGADRLGPGVPGRPGHAQQQPRPAQQVGRVDLQLDHPGQGLQRIAEQVPHPLHGAEQVADHGEPAALDVGVEDGRPAGAEHAALDLGRLQARIDRLIDADQLPGGFQVVDAVAQSPVAHGVSSSRSAGFPEPFAATLLRSRICSVVSCVRRCRGDPLRAVFCKWANLVAGIRTLRPVLRDGSFAAGHRRTPCWWGVAGTLRVPSAESSVRGRQLGPATAAVAVRLFHHIRSAAGLPAIRAVASGRADGGPDGFLPLGSVLR